jgi:DNA ligase-1
MPDFDPSSMKPMSYAKIRTRDVEEGKVDISKKYAGFYYSEKFDGWLAIWDGSSQLLTKSGSPLPAPSSFLKWFPKGTAVAGELIIKGKHAASVASLRKKGAADWSNARFYAFDLPGKKHRQDTFQQRYTILKKLINNSTGPVRVIVQKKVGPGFMKEFKKIVSHPFGEGVVITDPTSLYVGKRAGNMVRVKFKKRMDAEGTVVGYNGTNSLKVQMDGSGEVFSLGIDWFTKAERKNMKSLFAVGQRITYSYRKLSSKGKPIEASFLRMKHKETSLLPHKNKIINGEIKGSTMLGEGATEVLRDVTGNPKSRYSKQALQSVNLILKQAVWTIGGTATKIAWHQKKEEITAKEILQATRLEIGGELVKHAVSELSNAVSFNVHTNKNILNFIRNEIESSLPFDDESYIALGAIAQYLAAEIGELSKPKKGNVTTEKKLKAALEANVEMHEYLNHLFKVPKEKKMPEKEAPKPKTKPKKTTSKAGKIKNPETGRWVKKTGKIGKKILASQKKTAPKKTPKKTPPKKTPPKKTTSKAGKIKNPETGRWVKKTGKIGQKLLAAQKKAPKAGRFKHNKIQMACKGKTEKNGGLSAQGLRDVAISMKIKGAKKMTRKQLMKSSKLCKNN